jgi:hypothetical protein
MSFDPSDMLFPITLESSLLVLFLGCVMGYVLYMTRHRLDTIHIFWMLAGGAVFFIPLAILRGAQGATEYERLLGTFLLWVLYIAGFVIAGILYRKFTSGS